MTFALFSRILLYIQFILISATNWRHTNTSYMVSASVLRRLHTWSRASMGQDKLSALAMLHVHYMHPIDLLEVVDKFAKKHPRRMQLDNLLLH